MQYNVYHSINSFHVPLWFFQVLAKSYGLACFSSPLIPKCLSKLCRKCFFVCLGAFLWFFLVFVNCSFQFAINTLNDNYLYLAIKISLKNKTTLIILLQLLSSKWHDKTTLILIFVFSHAKLRTVHLYLGEKFRVIRKICMVLNG